ncbi:MAG: hypothetical protein M2R45_04302 [Verrucomicrobia subdivision 3 bacterium]|nr:hypothetical protein [Limisphaerales bacterium]MCS1417217.1 hypothetical protein [Limisphaerales bacterium]
MALIEKMKEYAIEICLGVTKPMPTKRAKY